MKGRNRCKSTWRTISLSKRSLVGVYWGRFNPPHKGHLSVIRKLKDKCNLVVAIGSSEHKNEKTNPFSGSERKEMMVSYLKESKIKGVRVVTLDDGESESWAVDNLIKKVKPDILFLSTEKSELTGLAKGRVHVVSFERTGVVSSTLIRDSITSGDDRWINLTGKSVAKLIIEFDGINRIRKAYGVDRKESGCHALAGP